MRALQWAISSCPRMHPATGSVGIRALRLAQNVPGVKIADVIAGIASKDVKAVHEAHAKAQRKEGLSRTARAELRGRIGRQYEALFRSAGVAAFAFPCVPIPAPPINPNGDAPGDQVEVNGHRLGRNVVLSRNTWWGARMGTPGLVVPAGMVSGLPVAMELEALPGDDSRLLGLGIAIEDVWVHCPHRSGGKHENAPTFEFNAFATNVSVTLRAIVSFGAPVVCVVVWFPIQQP